MRDIFPILSLSRVESEALIRSLDMLTLLLSFNLFFAAEL